MPRLSALLRPALWIALLALSGLAAAGCSGDDPSGAGGSGPGPDAGTDAQPSAVIRIDPPQASATVDLAGAAPSPVTFRAFYQADGEPEVEVTGMATWSAGNTAVASVAGGQATPVGIGGRTPIAAVYQDATGQGELTVKLTGELYLDGAGPEAAGTFAGATPDPDPANAPALEYPHDGVVLPSNLPPIEAQWTQASDNNLYRVRLTSPDVLEVALYTAGRELLFPADAWSRIGRSAPDAPISLAVDGVGPSNMVRAGAPRAMTVTADGIDESAIYVWQSSTGSFRVLDVIQGTDVPLPNNSPQLGAGQPCSGCHRISRDGKRFAYTYNGSNFLIGTLAYDEAQQIFAARVVPTAGVRGTYAAFNPLEETTSPAMLLTVPDLVPQNTAGTVRLSMVDPDTNMPVPSNVAEMILQIDPAVGRATLMPDWSADGLSVVFVAYNSDANYVRLLGDDVVLGSIVEAPISYDAATGSFQLGAPRVLVAAAPGDNPDTGINNLLPTFSPDGSAVAFTRAAGWWSIKTQQTLINLSGQIAVVRRSDGHVFELVKGSNGPGTTLSSTWPQWAPTMGQRYAWLAYASERPYGHRLTTQSPENAVCSLVQGQQQCKQLWITAVDRERLASGTEDPSAAPFWIPGQTLSAQYVSPQWTKAVLPTPE